MSALRNWLIANNHATTDPAEIRDRLSDQVEVYRDSQRWTMAGVMDVLGPEAVIAMERKLRAADLGVFSQALASGIQFDADSTRGALLMTQQLGVLTAEEVEAMLAIGLRYGPAWERAKLKELPSIREIQTVQATIATEELREQVAQRYQSVRDAIDAGEILTWEAARVALGAEWVDPVDSELEEISR